MHVKAALSETIQLPPQTSNHLWGENVVTAKDGCVISVKEHAKKPEQCPNLFFFSFSCLCFRCVIPLQLLQQQKLEHQQALQGEQIGKEKKEQMNTVQLLDYMASKMGTLT